MAKTQRSGRGKKESSGGAAERPSPKPGSGGGDRHAQGDEAGGNPSAGLVGREDDLAETDADLPEDGPYAGPAGGAVGGTPAGGRSSGGRTHGGLRPGGVHRGDSTLGTDPRSGTD